MTERTIAIQVHENTSSDIADVLCWISGYLAGHDGKHAWLEMSVESLREVNRQIKLTD